MTAANEKTIEILQNEFDALCQKMKFSAAPYRFFTVRQDNGAEHLEIIEDVYNLIATERGEEIARRTTTSKDEILYWLVSDFIWDLAIKFELKNRVAGQDFRRLFFAKQIERLAAINSDWARRRQKEIDEILQNHPFRDDM